MQAVLQHSFKSSAVKKTIYAQLGDYVEENDSIRFDDAYERNNNEHNLEE